MILFLISVCVLFAITGCKKFRKSSADTSQTEPAGLVGGTSSGKYSDLYYYPTTDSEGRTETGTPAGVYELSIIMYNGTFYMIEDARPQESLYPDDFKEVGKILEVNVCKLPTEDFCATGAALLCSGWSVLASPSDENHIAVQNEEGSYYTFTRMDENSIAELKANA